MAVRNLAKTRTTHSRRPKRRTPQHRRQQRRGRTIQTAVLAAATIAHASRHNTNTPAAVASAFLRPPALSPFREGGVGAGSGCFYAISGARRCCRVPSFLECPSTMGLGVWRPPVSRGRTDRTVDVLLSSSSGQGGLFEWRWGFGPGNSNSGLDRRRKSFTVTRTEIGDNNAVDVMPAIADSSKNKGDQQAFFTIPAFLRNGPPTTPKNDDDDDDDDAPSGSSVPVVNGRVLADEGGVFGSNGGKIGEEGEFEDLAAAVTPSSLSRQQEQTQRTRGGGLIRPGLGTEDGSGAQVDDDNSGDGGGQQERDRRRDMYKIRSLLLQGQIAGLRKRLQERELDVRELKILTGGRGQSKIRELGAMLKQARAECDSLRSREKALAEELAISQREGDDLRGDLLKNQKALADLNVYAESLRTRYTAEMVKLEASLAEMERELTRAEATHMRERRDLLDREAAAVKDGERFRNRTILLQGEVLKTRARETKLKDENARLTATSEAATAAADAAAEAAVAAAAGTAENKMEKGEKEEEKDLVAVRRQEEETALRAENDKLRSRLEEVLAGQEAKKETVASGDQDETAAEVEVVGADNDRSQGGIGSMLRGWHPAPMIVSGAAKSPPGMVSASAARPIPVEAVLSGDSTDSGAGPGGFSDEASAERALQEAGVALVVKGLREENVRLRKRLRAAEVALTAEEERANEEATRGDELEAELGRVRITVKGRVQALKAALEEAENDAELALAEKDEHMKQWGEDVDALRAQLVAERRAWENDRTELEDIAADLEDELNDLKERYRKQEARSAETTTSSNEKSAWGQRDRKKVTPLGNRKSDRSPTRAAGAAALERTGAKTTTEGAAGASKRGGKAWTSKQGSAWDVSGSRKKESSGKKVPLGGPHIDLDDGDDGDYHETAVGGESEAFAVAGDGYDLSPDEQWNKAMQLMQYLG